MALIITGSVYGEQAIVSKGDDEIVERHDDYGLWINAGKTQLSFNWPEEGWPDPNVGITAVQHDEWSYFAGVWYGSIITLYPRFPR
jgi:hypothetical protein